MNEALQIMIEMTESIGQRFGKVLEGVTPEEAEWRPLPQANNITLIVRHLCIEAEWHRAGLERGDAMPYEVTEDLQREIDAVPVDFARNRRAFEEAYSSFVSTLRKITLANLQQRTDDAYRGWPGPRSAHFLGFHQAMHVCMHLGQISMIRNLYRTTRGQPARFVPDNPSFPKTDAG